MTSRAQIDLAAASSGLPVAAALPALLCALSGAGRAVLTAPPGAGKTTLVPLALLGADWAEGRILMLEPRRLAARAAAERMAALLGERVGETVGYRVRGEAKIGRRTRIEVLTEGILTRMLQSDPALEGVAAVIFDEFHERSIHADLGLALAWEARGALRPDLRIVAMSATLDAAPVAALMDGAPMVHAEGRAFPVETRWLDRSAAGRVEAEAAAAARRALAGEEGDILIFLPGAREIGRALRLLEGVEAEIRPLHGALSFAAQRAALAPAGPGRRKVVLASAIAETSLTVEGVRVVIDGGLARRSRFDPGAGMARLVTERVTRAEADQRRGRAGRLGPGLCIRLWTRGEEAGFAPFAPPEITAADLAPFALDLANWGAAPGDLRFLDPPPEAGLAAARRLLGALGALDGAGRITGHGRAMAAAPAHPRLAHMMLSAPAGERGAAAALAALIEARDPMIGAGADIGARLNALSAPGRAGAAEGALRRIRAEAERLAKRVGAPPPWRGGGRAPAGPLLARAFPDRVAMRRPGAGPTGAARYLLASGKGAWLPAEDALAAEPFLVAADLDGDATEARIRLAAPIGRAEIDALFADRIEETAACRWNRRERRVSARRRLTLGALALEERPWPEAPEAALAAALIEGVRDLGLEALPWTPAARRLAARGEWARARGAAAPSLAPKDLLAELEDWLAPYLPGCRKLEDLTRLDLHALLSARLGHEGRRAVDRVAPEAFTAPDGGVCRIDYDGAAPAIAAPLQAFFGLDRHPTAGGEALSVSLLSPAGRPLQVTADLPGFWRSSYADVRKEMRGRYPRHPWPEDPLSAAPTRRAKPRARR
ncbi:ATP-dependent helicase HrpB [Pikeienuella sp. HZG-20]|uniref:ATP-dependent helicase HrpB n=1 Tax=Paludibacillus litoralis TaxID=3133267 RepID=UPI0030EB4CA5